MSLRVLRGVAIFGVVVPVLVFSILAVAGKVNFHSGDDWMLLVLACLFVFAISGIVSVVAGLVLLARTEGQERTHVIIWLLIGGAPVWWIILSLTGLA